MSRELTRRKGAKKKGRKSADDDDSEEEMELSDEEVQHPQLLPSATVVAERLCFLCFHRCLSVHGGEVYTTPPRQTPPPSNRRPLQQTVRILVECILVLQCLHSYSTADLIEPLLHKATNRRRPYFHRPQTKFAKVMFS